MNSNVNNNSGSCNTPQLSSQHMISQNKPFSYYQSPQASQTLIISSTTDTKNYQNTKEYLNIEQSNNNDLLQVDSKSLGLNNLNLLQTQTAITDDSYCEAHHKPLTDYNHNIISSKHEIGGQLSQLNNLTTQKKNTIFSTNNNFSLNNSSSVQNLNTHSATGILPRQSSEQVLKTIQNIKVQGGGGIQTPNVVQNNMNNYSNYQQQLLLHHNYSQAKLHTVRLDDNDYSKNNNNKYQQQLLHKSKEFASLVVVEENCKSDSKLKLNTPRILDSQMNQYNQLSVAHKNIKSANHNHHSNNNNNNSNNHISQNNSQPSIKQHPKHSVVISASNKLSQLSQQQYNQHQVHTLSNSNSRSSMMQYQAALLSPQSVSSSHSTTSLKHHISQQHQMQLLQLNNQKQQQQRMNQSNTDSNVYQQQQYNSNNSNSANIVQKSSTSIHNNIRDSKDKFIQSLTGSGILQNNNNNNNGSNNCSIDKRTSINSYNKRVVELNLNQQNQQQRDGVLLKVGPQTMKNQAIKQLSLDISELPSQSTVDINSKYPEQQQEAMPGKSMNQTINQHQSNQMNSAQNSQILSIEKIKPQIKIVPISTNISPKNQNILFGSPRISINSINNTVSKSKLMLRKQQQTTATSVQNKSGVNNLNKSDQQQLLHDSNYNSGNGTLQVSQSLQSIHNSKQTSPQFNRFIQQSKTGIINGNKKISHNTTAHNLHQHNITLSQNQSYNQSSTQLLRNLSQDAGLKINNTINNNNNAQSKQLRISESHRDLKQAGQILESQRLLQNSSSAFENKRESQRYYSPNQMSLNKALSRISSVGELNKMKNQIATQRKSIQNKQPQSQLNSISSNNNVSGMTTMLTANLIMQNAQKNNKNNENNNNNHNKSQSSRSQDRKTQVFNFDKSKQLAKKQQTQQMQNGQQLTDRSNQILSTQEQDFEEDNEYMTNQEKLWNSIETNQDYKIIEEILKKSDVKVDQKNIFDDSWSALHYAVHEGNLLVIKLLIESYQAQIDQRSASNKTPFHLACIRGDEKIIKYLIEKGASPHVVDRDGCTPLHYLCETENHEMVKFILPIAAASKDVRNRFGKKPVDLIQDKEIKRLLRNYSTRRESQSRLTLQQQNSLAQQQQQVKSLSRERSKSGGNNVIQITRLNDGQEVQDQIQQMFRKFTQFQSKHLNQNAKTNKKEEVKSHNSGNLSHRNVTTPSNLNNSGKKTNNLTSRLTLGPQAAKQQIPQSQPQSVKSIQKLQTLSKPSQQPEQNQKTSQNLLLKNISPSKQINLNPSSTQSKTSTSLNSSQSVRNLNSKTPGLQSVKSHSKLLELSCTLQQQQQSSQNKQKTKKLASIQSVTSLLQEKQKQLENKRQAEQQQQKKVKEQVRSMESSQNDQFELSKEDHKKYSSNNNNNHQNHSNSDNKSNSLQKSSQPKIQINNNQDYQHQSSQEALEDQGSLSQRTGDSSQFNNDLNSNLVVNKNHKLTTFSLNQISDGNGQDIEEKNKSEQEQKVGPWSFIAHQLLGTGSFGEVFLVEKISNGKFYAMKVLTKSKIMGHNLTRYALTERNVMSIVNHPFIVKLNYAFQTQEKLFLILDYCPGGDLAEYLQLEKRFNEDKVRLYSSEILLALEELHRKDIIFRDLKPDNVVLDHEGHAMLTDFGLSKEGVMKEGMAKSFCGSYAYLAPEMLKKLGHGKAVDWYLLGVIIYEMLCGVPPYYANNKEELFENIKHASLDIPQYVLPLAKDIILRLLHRNPKKRLGTIGGADEIKKHPFFKNIDWTKLSHRAYRAPEPYLRKRFENFLSMSPALQTNSEVYESLRKQALFKSQGEPDQHIPGWSFVSPVKESE